MRPLPVERAFEANEGATKQKQNETSTRPSAFDATIDKNVAEESRFSPKSSKNLTTTTTTGQSFDESPPDDVDRMRKSRYEIPDNQLSRKAVNILAGKKEMEMHEFYGTDEDNSECDDRKLVLVPNVDPSGDRDSPENV